MFTRIKGRFSLQFGRYTYIQCRHHIRSLVIHIIMPFVTPVSCVGVVSVGRCWRLH